MEYSIHQLAEIAGISVRTLHYYDEIALLSPRRDVKNQYRTYTEHDLLLLQQILFFRELDFGLEDIKKILSNKDFDLASALADHRKMILLKKKRIDGLIKTIDKTLLKINNKKYMKDEELYDSFSKEEMEELAVEAKERWGHTEAYKESEQKMRNMPKEGMDKIKKEGHDLLTRGAELVKAGKTPDSAEAQALIADHYKHLSNFYTPNPEMYKGLAEMYIADTRFTEHFAVYHSELPQFMHDAMIIFVEKR